MRLLTNLTVGALFFSVSLSASANPFTIYGAGPAGQALGGAVGANPSDSFAAFYNPATLAFLENGEISLQYLSVLPKLTIERLEADSDPTILNATPVNTFGINIGATIPIIPQKLMLGLALYMPKGTNLLVAESLEPVRPQFYMYQSLHNRFELIPALAYRPIKELSIGFGVELSALVSAKLDSVIISIDPATNEANLQRNLIADAKIIASPIVGATIQPIDQLRIGFSFKGKNDGNIKVEADVITQQADLADLNLTTDTNTFFIPAELSFSAAFALTPQVKLMAQVDHQLWSKASNPETTIATVINVNGAPALDLQTAVVQLNFKDVTTPRIGVEVTPIEQLKLRAGYFFRPTHVPNQGGVDSNFLDANTSGISFGAAGEFRNTLLPSTLPIKIEASYLLQAMQQGAVGKAEADDPVGNIGFTGQVHSLFFALSQKF
jgi:long-chain fatty acid transport protein